MCVACGASVLLRAKHLQGAHRLFFFLVNSKMEKTRVVFASDDIMEDVLFTHARVNLLSIENLIRKFMTAGPQEIAGQLSTKLIQGVAFSHIKDRKYTSTCIEMQDDGQGRSHNCCSRSS